MAAEDYIDINYDDLQYIDEDPHSCLARGEAILKQNRRTGEAFIGCTAWPSCRWSARIESYPFAFIGSR